ncbi:MAG: hypothetical protein ACFFDN_39010 [Candidatus Hodarchaeota archaeon]
MTNFIKRNIPLTTLILLSPTIGELLSGSAPPLEFFNPFVFIILVGLYGLGVLIIRELCVKWEKGWWSILILGIAYGIIEEGLAVKSFFDPNWVDLGNLGEYGRLFDVNWVWSVWLTIYYTIVSIAIPILLFELLFPDKKDERLLTENKLKVVIILFIIDVTFTFLFLTPYFPNFLLYLLTLIIVILLILIAWKISPDIITLKNDEPIIRAGWFGIAGLIAIFSLFIINWTLTYLIPVFIIPVILDLLVPIFLLRFTIKYAGYNNNSYHKLAFASGFLASFIVLAFIHELNGVFGMSVVGIFFILFLFYVRKKVLSEQNTGKVSKLIE